MTATRNAFDISLSSRERGTQSRQSTLQKGKAGTLIDIKLFIRLGWLFYVSIPPEKPGAFIGQAVQSYSGRLVTSRQFDDRLTQQLPRPKIVPSTRRCQVSFDSLAGGCRFRAGRNRGVWNQGGERAV